MKDRGHLNDLEHRSKMTERKVLTSLYSNAANETRQALGLHLFEIDDAVLLASVEGDPQHSYRNIIKYSFAEIRVRHNYKPIRF